MARARLRFLLATASALLLHVALLVAKPARADLLVIAPHPDDDLLIAAGVTLRARQAGEKVWVLFMTNGDVLGVASGLTRQDEAVEAQKVLGASEDDLIFLGYPDGSLQELRGEYAALDKARAGGTNRNRQTTTFGQRGLGRTDYHRYVFGESANNNGANLRTDLTHVLSTYHPTQIFVTGEADRHSDHYSTYAFLRDALTATALESPSYNPIVHKAIVWNDFTNQDAWPTPADPHAYFTEPPHLAERSKLVWASRESLDVPLELQQTTLTENLKWRAIDAHGTQGGNKGYIGKFVHKDEVFWPMRAQGSNRPPVPNAGSDQHAARGASVTLNGSASRDPEGRKLSYQWRQSAGPSVELTNATSARPSFVVPQDAAVGSVLVFEVKVADGLGSGVPDAVSVRVNGAPLVRPKPPAATPDAGAPVAAVDGARAPPDSGKQAAGAAPLKHTAVRAHPAERTP
jgi:LmbE family N-acetylglucosaminyl deacetylase